MKISGIVIEPQTISVADVALALGVSRTAAYRATANGEIPVIRVAGRVLVPRAWLDHVLGEWTRSYPLRRKRRVKRSRPTRDDLVGLVDYG